MKIKLLDFGYTNPPTRAHANDAGADVFAPYYLTLGPGEVHRMPLGFGVDLPDGYAGWVFPRGSLSSQGIVCELSPIDSGYQGEVHAILSNVSNDYYHINKGDRVGQLVIMPVVIADFTTTAQAARGTGAFGSTGQ